ncbi:MAG: glycosyltransferase, partial [Planctomycetia bacterium]|nr:glycosyltransferase [Planctomycetia bacterium]
AAAADLVAMRRLGFDSIRTYCLPPAWLLAAAEEHGIAVLLDVPWAKHLSFLDSARLKADARQAVAAAAAVGGRFQSVLAYSIGNEIPADIVRWHGARQVARFLGELADVVHQTDPRGLVTYANFPPTEYLEIPGLDFVTYNVYLHDREVFRRYILRLQHLVGDRPLVLGEMGMDTLRHGEAAQAAFLAGHLREAALLGVAGSFVFAWTDQWHTGGHLIEDWAFGIPWPGPHRLPSARDRPA